MTASAFSFCGEREKGARFGSLPRSASNQLKWRGSM